MTASTKNIPELPHALHDGAQFAQRLAGRRPAVFLDYDGTLTPIVEDPAQATLAPSMRAALERLAARPQRPAQGAREVERA